MATSRALLSRGMRLTGNSGRTYELTTPCVRRCDGLPSSTWIAFDIAKPSYYSIVKQPYNLTPHRLTLFHREMVLQETFKDSIVIRSQEDIVPEVKSESDGKMLEPPRLVLETMQKTVWHARWQRTFTRKEIKWIMRCTLAALENIEAQGLVNVDLRMENMMLNNHGDEPTDPSGDPPLVPKLADLSHLFLPQQGSCMMCTYRAPEVHFGKPWSFPAHIWSWGIILTQLLEARVDLKSRGIYAEHSFIRTSKADKDASYGCHILHDFALDTIPFFADLGLKRDPARMFLPNWSERLEEKGLRLDDISFLKWVLDPNPESRPTLAQIARSGWLEFNPGDDEPDNTRRTSIFSIKMRKD